jgi:hypothetical protein
MSLCDKRVGFFPSPNNWDIFRAPHHGLREPQLELRFEEAVKSNNSAPRHTAMFSADLSASLAGDIKGKVTVQVVTVSPTLAVCQFWSARSNADSAQGEPSHGNASLTAGLPGDRQAFCRHRA